MPKSSGLLGLGVSPGLWHTMLLNSLFKALFPTGSVDTQLSGEGRYLGGGVRCLRAGWAEQPEVVPGGRAAAGTSERAQQPLSLQTLGEGPSLQRSPIGCPAGTFFLTVGLAGRCGSTFRAALSR